MPRRRYDPAREHVAAPADVDVEWPEVYPASDYVRGTARALLDAARAVGVPEESVQSIFGGFRAPPTVVAATVFPSDPDAHAGSAPELRLALETGVAPKAGATDAPP